MNKKTLAIFIAIYLFLYSINYLTPMSFGDDYLYSFVWQGHSMFTPLTEDATRVSSLQDLFASQWSLYLTWGGRIVGQMLTQIFVWIGKDIFNIINAFVGVLLVAEVYWCINKGVVGLNFKPTMIWWIFFSIWSFAPGFSDAFFWLTGACIYLWPMFFLLCFLIPYVRKFYFYQEQIGKSCLFHLAMFLLGAIAGCGNENSVFWVILFLLYFLLTNRKRNLQELWMYTGLAGLILGYIILMLAPGNMARLYSMHGSEWFNMEVFKHHFSILLVVLLFQAFMWYYSLTSIYVLKKPVFQHSILHQDIILAQTLLATAFGMSAIMLFSPEFPLRSGFPGTIPLLMATGILFRIQKENHIELIKKSAGICLRVLGTLYFLMTVLVTTVNFYEKNAYMKEILVSVKQVKQTKETIMLYVKPFRKVSFSENLLSGLHIPNYDLKKDVNSWSNVAFARYYGIKGIQVIDDEHY